jgi:hypothetical protein
MKSNQLNEPRRAVGQSCFCEQVHHQKECSERMLVVLEGYLKGTKVSSSVESKGLC